MTSYATPREQPLGSTEEQGQLDVHNARKRRRRRLTGTSASAYAMLAPGLILFLLFLAIPIAYTLVLSFQGIQRKGLGLGSGGRELVFAGLTNYINSLSDPDFLESVGRVLLYGAILIPTLLFFAMVFALCLDSVKVHGGPLLRLLIFLPFAVPAVISSLLWAFLYLPELSPLYHLLSILGIQEAPSLLSPQFVVFAIANIGFWGGVGFNMIVIYTALRAVPTELYEAARLDGASEIQIAARIKLPIIAPALVMTTLFTIIAVFQVYSEPTTLRPLGNGISQTWSPLMVVYRDAFTRSDIYQASATSIVIAAVTFFLSFISLRIVQRRAFGQE
jgi:multiple sugar transport system permease protein